MSKVYFFSDVHLGLGSREQDRLKEDRVLEFLAMVGKDADELYIVGDLFDAWIEYKSVIPKGHHRLFTKLEELTRKGITVHFLVGNHDFWIRDFFTTELGIKTYLHPIETIIDGKRFYIHHGDGLALNDTGYLILKKVLRNPVAIFLYRWVHPDIGYGLARSTSKNSRSHTATKDYGERDGMIAAATKKISEGFDAVIMGHRHNPVRQEIGNGVYINLGDWMSFNTYAVAENGTLKLLTFTDSTNGQ